MSTESRWSACPAMSLYSPGPRTISCIRSRVRIAPRSIHMRTLSTVAMASLLVLAGCGRTPVSSTEVASITAPAITIDAASPVWKNAPVHTAKLMLQDLVEPRLMKASTQEVRVRSVHTASEIAFLLQWTDATANDLPG